MSSIITSWWLNTLCGSKPAENIENWSNPKYLSFSFSVLGQKGNLVCAEDINAAYSLINLEELIWPSFLFGNGVSKRDVALSEFSSTDPAFP